MDEQARPCPKFHDKSSPGNDCLTNNNNDETEVFIEDSPSSSLGKFLPETVQKPILSTLDLIISIVVVGPCTVGFWRGTWELMDLYPDYFPIWTCFWLGVAIHVAFNICQDHLEAVFFKKSQSVAVKAVKFAVMRTYTYIFGIVCNLNWRGAWEIIDEYLGVQMTPNGARVVKEGSELLMIISAASFALVIVLKCVGNCYAPPFVICLDRKEEMFVIPTRFKTKMAEKAYLYILDCLFSVFVIGTLVVFVWRGAWALLDIYLFPENEVMSAWASLGIGYAAVATAFLLQPAMKWICDRLTGGSRLLVADLFLIFSLIGTVNVWRGIWNLLNIYLMPDDLELSCWITHWVCLLVLVLLGCSNSLLVRGVYIDAEEPAGKCVVFPCYYLRLIFQNQQKLKIKRPEPEKGIKTELASIKSIENNHIIEPLEVLNHKTEV